LSGERSVETTDGSTAGSRYQTDERQVSTIDPCRFFRFYPDSVFGIKPLFPQEIPKELLKSFDLSFLSSAIPAQIRFAAQANSSCVSGRHPGHHPHLLDVLT
jgi:hypothetical protein